MESDERFKIIASDPRFKNLRKKEKKVKIDDRFKSMFTDKKFTFKYSKDKRGRNKKKTSADDLKKYYALENEETEEVEESKNSESELSSSSDESESEDEQERLGEGFDDWKPLDHDAETADSSTKRLAVQNLDWDHLSVEDIYTLIHSVRPPQNVKIYISEFGKERLEREAVEGPKEILAESKLDDVEEEYNQLRDKMRALKNNEPKAEYEDADEEMDDETRERIRKYQLQRMKYYYAIAEFDSIESAELVYKELDGREYENSSLELDLRFVPDDVEFEEKDARAICDKMPDLASYKAPQFISSALQQTTVKLTWDETDTKRQEKLLKAYTKEELDKNDLEAYLASDDDDEDSDGREEYVSKYKMLVESLEDEEEGKKKVDVDVEWGNSSSEEEQEEEQEEEEEDESGEVDLLVMNTGSERDNFEFNPEDQRFKAIYESGLYNIDPSHPNFKRTKALEMIAEKKREKRQKSTNFL